MKKKITFLQPSTEPPRSRSIIWVFPFKVVDSSLVGTPEESIRTTQHRLRISASTSLAAVWGFGNLGPDDDSLHARHELMKVLFEFGHRHVERKLKEDGTLPQVEELNLSTYNAEVPCPFDPARIKEPEGATFEVEIENQDAQAKHPDQARDMVPFVDESRIEELRAIKSDKFDLRKLIELCEELNLNYRNDRYLAVAILGRVVLDHIPPIFGYKNFTSVANNYGGGKSFNKSMTHLENSLRNIADGHLHEQIGRKETLPNKTQVNFSNDLDVLLAEIIKILS